MSTPRPPAPVDRLSCTQGLLANKTFLGGSRPGAEDACVYTAAASLPSEVLRTAPGVKGWLNTVGMFAPSMRLGWGRGSVPSAGATASAAGSRAKKGGLDAGNKSREIAATPAADVGGAGDDDMDDLFGDEGDHEDGGVEEKKSSRAEQMAAAKASKEKAKKVDRYVLLVFNIGYLDILCVLCVCVSPFVAVFFVNC